jgi:hypothetical protein
MAVALVAGLAAGVLAWVIGEGILAVETADQRFVPGNQGEIAQHDAMIQQARILKATASYAALGAVVGLLLGLAGGWARGSGRASAVAGVSGALVGGVATAAITWLTLPIFLSDVDTLNEGMLAPILMHGLFWAAAGLAGGLAFAVGLGCRPVLIVQAAIGGIVGALLGAAVYDIVGAIVLTTENTAMPLSEGWASRLLARMSVAVLVAVVAASMLDQRRPQPTPITTPSETPGV